MSIHMFQNCPVQDAGPLQNGHEQDAVLNLKALIPKPYKPETLAPK